jgi:hypothetical protein
MQKHLKESHGWVVKDRVRVVAGLEGKGYTEVRNAGEVYSVEMEEGDGDLVAISCFP